jgi:uncharacterized membrane protein YraQ (UPF0718 family)
MQTGARSLIAPYRRVGWRPSARLRASAPAVVVAALAAILVAFEPAPAVTTFATVFLGVFFEALPFLLLGVLVSAIVQELVPPALVTRLVPRGRLRAALAGAMLGAIFPVCECGVVPVARRLLDKGASLPAALGFMLAGPVVNPIVFWATWTALGPGMAALRLGTSLVMAVAVAWLYGLHPEPEAVIAAPAPTAPPAAPPVETGAVPASDPVATPSGAARLFSAVVLAGDELLEMGRYLVVGAAAAAILRTIIPGPTLVAAGQGAILAVPLTMALAALLSICSVVDAFVALSLTGLVSTGAILAFLVFGPVVDLKSILLYGTVLRWRTVIMLVIMLSQIALLVGLAVGLNVG